ncbi:hypothetical protein AVEN_66959-1 [Araneus ventricosus]|uniref:Uncharacterized protein n=1 Tax=Araneus ventricosus TaxID=182803 RepID=A0A4Y2U3U8_ARAVE|nr:hypothetical protein AVEN_66959-1 [Araneus ventricosus]
MTQRSVSDLSLPHGHPQSCSRLLQVVMPPSADAMPRQFFFLQSLTDGLLKARVNSSDHGGTPSAARDQILGDMLYEVETPKLLGSGVCEIVIILKDPFSVVETKGKRQRDFRCLK